MKYEYLLFDLDGTLTDPKIGIIKSFLYTLNKLKIQFYDSDILLTFIGPPLVETFKNYFKLDDKKTKQAIEFFREYFHEKGFSENQLYPDIVNLLINLKRNDFNIFMATSKLTKYAEKIADHFGIKPYFEEIVGCNEDNSRVEKKEIIQYIIKEFDLRDLSKVLMIGDRKHDIIGAQLCGIDSVAVTWGYGSESEINQVNPTYIVNSVYELEKITQM